MRELGFESYVCQIVCYLIYACFNVILECGDESIFKSKEAKEKPCEIDEASWRRMKVRKLEDERRSGAAMVFGEALK